MRKAKRDIPKPKGGWGRRKRWEEPSSDDPEAFFKFRCDKVAQEIDDRLRASAKVYTSETHSQEFLRALVSPKSL